MDKQPPHPPLSAGYPLRRRNSHVPEPALPVHNAMAAPPIRPINRSNQAQRYQPRTAIQPRAGTPHPRRLFRRKVGFRL
jgi:hypothetical protein